MRRAACALFALTLAGCSVAGPAALSSGRATYNAVINETEDQQVLSAIVRQRYGETFGMLAVSSVTASLKVGAQLGVNAGAGPSENYAGNLVPLSAEATYEENPTISYVPLRGEQFVEKMLAPLTAEQALLLTRMSTEDVEVLRYLVRRANGLVNPLYSSAPSSSDDFDDFIDRIARLREAGKLDVVGSGDGRFEMLIHDYTEPESADVADLLKSLGIKKDVHAGTEIKLPLRFYVGSRQPNGVDLETPSALEVIEAATLGVDVPTEHVAAGIAGPQTGQHPHALITVHSSKQRPAFASVAIRHRGWWFFVDGRDAASKHGFMILRTLIGLRLDAAGPAQSAPVLTVPVTR